MLFGQSLFQSVLERLNAEAIEEEEQAAGQRSYRVQGLGASFIAEEVRGAAADLERGQALYREIMEERPAPEPPPQQAADEPDAEPDPEPPAHLMRQAPEEIAADLGLTARDSIATLTEKRRAFARLNHPDSVRPDFRDLATVRMQTANLLVDEAIRRRT